MERFQTFEQANKAGYAVPLASINPRHYFHNGLEHKIPEEIDKALPRHIVELESFDGRIDKIQMVKLSDIQRVLTND